MYALEAVNLIIKYLPVAVHEGKNLEAHSAVAWASTESGIVESLSSCVSHHSILYSMLSKNLLRILVWMTLNLVILVSKKKR
jgi:alcohol dehydrogenase class IV